MHLDKNVHKKDGRWLGKLILWPDIAVDMKIKSVGSQAGGVQRHKGDVQLLIVHIEYLSTIDAQTRFGFKKFGEV